MFAAMLINAAKFNCSDEMLTIVSMLSVPNVFLRPNNQRKEADAAKASFAHPDGDHLALLNVYLGYKQNEADSANWCWNNYLNPRSIKSADNVRSQLSRIMIKAGMDLIPQPHDEPKYFDNIRKALVTGFFMHVAHLERSGYYLTAKDNQVTCVCRFCYQQKPDISTDCSNPSIFGP
jgi:pre-mRNA-splicing factor ATP-dependent RNA helicase DHX15/PRP43